jgi:BirA family biotin operon repressor/biotin-[acetyl-CoA-carboxylase] ligase
VQNVSIHDLTPFADRLGIFAGRVRTFDDVTSTSDLVAAWADAGGEEGLVAVADQQTRGRGRLGRSWSSPPGAGIYLSALLRPPASAIPLLTLAAGVAVAEGIEAAASLETILKWPNDVCVSRADGSWRKLAGILAEARSGADGVRHVVLGIGVNVLPAAHPPDVSQRATSLAEETGRSIERSLVIGECLAALAKTYRALLDGERASLLDAWTTRAQATFRRDVVWEDGTREVRGTVDGVDASGALLLRTDEGLRRATAGEVRWI